MQKRQPPTENEKLAIFNTKENTTMSYKEIAELFNRNIHTVESIVSKERLKRSIEAGYMGATKIDFNNEMSYGGESFRTLFIPADESLCVGDVIFKR